VMVYSYYLFFENTFFIASLLDTTMLYYFIFF